MRSQGVGGILLQRMVRIGQRILDRVEVMIIFVRDTKVEQRLNVGRTVRLENLVRARVQELRIARRWRRVSRITSRMTRQSQTTIDESEWKENTAQAENGKEENEIVRHRNTEGEDCTQEGQKRKNMIRRYSYTLVRLLNSFSSRFTHPFSIDGPWLQ